MFQRRPARQYTPSNVGPKPVYLTKGLITEDKPMTSKTKKINLIIKQKPKQAVLVGPVSSIKSIKPLRLSKEQKYTLYKGNTYNSSTGFLNGVSPSTSGTVNLTKPSPVVVKGPKSASVVKNGSPVKALQSLPINPVRTVIKYNPNRSLIKTNSNRVLVKYGNNKPKAKATSPKKTIHLHKPIKKTSISKPNRNTIIQKSTLITTTMKK